jgi:putative FmdB family regulatory protein
MPIYEYACRKCGAGFEKRLKFEERLAARTCPSCGATGAVLRMSAPGLVGVGSSRSFHSSSSDVGTCPSTGQPCSCGHAHQH